MVVGMAGLRKAYNLAAASAIGNLDAVQDLLAIPGIEVDFDGRFTPALIQAASNGHVDIVKALIAAGANVNRDYNHTTPLIEAAKNGHLDVVKALIAGGANVNQYVYMKTALRVAAGNGHTRIVEILLKAGTNVTRPGQPGFTSLMFDEPRRYPDILRLFLRYGAILPDPAKFDEYGNYYGALAREVVRNVQAIKHNTRRNKLASVLVERRGETGLPNNILQEVGRKYLGGKSRRLRKRR